MCGLIVIFSFLRHVLNICKSCFAQIRDLNALVGTRHDYCNSLFRSLPGLYFRKLQCVQNSLASIVTNTTKYSHTTPVSKTLHKLPVEHHSIFKAALLSILASNDLPDDILQSSLHSFRKKLKTYLFTQAYPP